MLSPSIRPVVQLYSTILGMFHRIKFGSCHRFYFFGYSSIIRNNLHSLHRLQKPSIICISKDINRQCCICESNSDVLNFSFSWGDNFGCVKFDLRLAFTDILYDFVFFFMDPLQMVFSIRQKINLLHPLQYLFA